MKATRRLGQTVYISVGGGLYWAASLLYLSAWSPQIGTSPAHELLPPAFSWSAIAAVIGITQMCIRDRSGADGCSESGCQSTEMRDIALGTRIGGERELDGLRQLTLDEARLNGEKQMAAEQKRDHCRPPHEAVDSVE